MDLGATRHVQKCLGVARGPRAKPRTTSGSHDTRRHTGHTESHADTHDTHDTQTRRPADAQTRRHADTQRRRDADTRHVQNYLGVTLYL